MDFNSNNEVIRLCSKGMELEARGEAGSALHLFENAWQIAFTDVEKFTAAHYIARHQDNILDKLKWDETALQHALRVNDDNVNVALPSLYLNIAKCYEDLNDFEKARIYYAKALSFAGYLPDDGYGNMIRNGIGKGIERTMLPE